MTSTTSKGKRSTSSRSSASKGKTGKKRSAKKRKPGSVSRTGPDAHRESCRSWSERHGVRALGLDLSVAGTGIAVVRGADLLHHRRVKTAVVPSRKQPRPVGYQPDLGKFEGSFEQRVDWISRKVVWVCHEYDIEIACIEGHSYASKGNTALLHELHGVVKNRLCRLNIPFIVRSPSTVKLHATGNGDADKLDMIAAAKRAGFKDCWNDDEADAYHLARYVLDFPPEEWLASVSSSPESRT